MTTKVGSAVVAAVIALFLVSTLAAAVYAASGPSAVVKKDTPKPQPKAGEVTPDEATKYKCSTIDTMRERIKCRMQLKEENEYDYLPEECRAQVNESRENCVSNYKKSQQCWVSLNDTKRFECAKKSFGLVFKVAVEKDICNNGTSFSRPLCILQLRDSVDAVVKFRIYNLEEKAQRLMGKGLVELDTVTAFVTAMEQQKQNYNDAKTVEEKKAVVRGVQKLWKDFISSIKPGLAGKNVSKT